MSPYYEAFVKYGRACQVNEWLEPEKYTEWLITKGVKLKQWTSDKSYNTYIQDFVRKETGLRALERTVVYLSKWSEEADKDWQSYFEVVSPSRAVHDIRSAKVSPWVIYLSQTGDLLLQKFNDEQVAMIKDFIDPPPPVPSIKRIIGISYSFANFSAAIIFSHIAASDAPPLMVKSSP